MTPIYIVKTKHTESVLKAFIDFRYRMMHPKSAFRILLFDSCIFMLAFTFRGKSAMYVFLAIGALMLAMLIARKSIALGRLEKSDPNYQNQSEIVFTFGHSEFYVNNKEIKDESHVKYGEVSSTYQDDGYYYVGVNNEELHILPKADFITGDAQKFAEFMEDKTKRVMVPVKLPLKEKLKEMRQNSYRGQLEKKWEEEKKAQENKVEEQEEEV